MEPSITELTISGFRTLKNFNVKGLGRVNLITGRNNTGKSSILEAIRILASRSLITTLTDILRYREEYIDAKESSRQDKPNTAFSVTSLFTSFPELSNSIAPIDIKTGGQRITDLSIELRIGWLASEMKKIKNDIQSDDETQSSYIKDDQKPVLVVKTPNSHFIFSARDNSQNLLDLKHYHRSVIKAEPSILSMFVSAYGGERTANLGALWDGIVLSNNEQDVIKALQIIEPEITAVTMIGGESQPRTAIVRTGNFSRPVPLRSFGDGMNRLFGIILSLVNAKGGFLLIDEFENGMHHTVQLDAWRIIFSLAQSLDVQVFATSHSWDAIESFQKAAEETKEDGALIRLTRKGEDIIPTVFKEKELAIATRAGIEVR